MKKLLSFSFIVLFFGTLLSAHDLCDKNAFCVHTTVQKAAKDGFVSEKTPSCHKQFQKTVIEKSTVQNCECTISALPVSWFPEHKYSSETVHPFTIETRIELPGTPKQTQPEIVFSLKQTYPRPVPVYLSLSSFLI